MKSTVSAGRYKNVALRKIPDSKPQTTGFCFPNQCLNPPIFPLKPWPKTNTITNTHVRILISGKLSQAASKSQSTSYPTKVFKLLHIIPVSSSLKINHVMNTKYCVNSQLVKRCDLANLCLTLLFHFVEVMYLCMSSKIPCISPQRMKFHDAPCHNPPSNIVPIIAITRVRFPPREPPNGMYK